MDALKGGGWVKGGQMVHERFVADYASKCHALAAGGGGGIECIYCGCQACTKLSKLVELSRSVNGVAKTRNLEQILSFVFTFLLIRPFSIS